MISLLKNVSGTITGMARYRTGERPSLALMALMLIVFLEFFLHPRLHVFGAYVRLVDLACLLAFALFCASYLKQGYGAIRQFVRDNRFLLALLVLIACGAVISFAFSTRKLLSLKELIQALEGPLITVITIWAARDTSIFGDIKRIVIFMCLFQAALGFLQFVGNYGEIYMEDMVRVSGTLGNYLATYLLVGFVTSTAYSIQPRESRWKTYLVISSIFFSTLLLVQVKTVWMLLLSSFAILLYFTRSLMALKRILFLLALGFAMFLAANVLQGAQADYLHTLSSRGLGTVHVRLELWSAAVRIFLDHPLTGSGLGTYGAFYLQEPYASSALREFARLYALTETDAHSMFLTRLAETGILGTSAYLLFYIYLLASAYKLGKCAKGDGAILAVSLVIMLSFLSDAISDYIGGKLFWVFAGLLEMQRQRMLVQEQERTP